ncbi:hypothetical protein HYH03_010022 [Edaphochlamys debaryana]|uniref:Uncharacterized protein n=1 Tax=Edaphochlamys debaryana TaxID=47281 RepID=A0A836BX45_9CHLO|nr:hypothetical protein HYH03_010022 [Edaphochlamys debaryana]|eukprot:KAG2491652.1 hypothetical protein HYH03_010022 [Edaphochlamys debaryana]
MITRALLALGAWLALVTSVPGIEAGRPQARHRLPHLRGLLQLPLGAVRVKYDAALYGDVKDVTWLLESGGTMGSGDVSPPPPPPARVGSRPPISQTTGTVGLVFAGVAGGLVGIAICLWSYSNFTFLQRGFSTSFWKELFRRRSRAQGGREASQPAAAAEGPSTEASGPDGPSSSGSGQDRARSSRGLGTSADGPSSSRPAADPDTPSVSVTVDETVPFSASESSGSGSNSTSAAPSRAGAGGSQQAPSSGSSLGRRPVEEEQGEGREPPPPPRPDHGAAITARSS